MLYCRVPTLKRGPGGQKELLWLPQFGNGACTVVGIFEVPKYSLPSNTSPSQLAALMPNEAFHPFRSAQCPALKRPVCAKEYPPNNSKRGNLGTTGGCGMGTELELLS